MIGIYIICLLLFPLSIVFHMKRTAAKETFLGKSDTNVIKGVATCFIIFAHLIISMRDELHGIGVALNVYTVTGGMGVLLFFFVSGYGICKAHGQRKLTVNYWIQRLLNVYLPSVLIQAVFGLLIMVQEKYIDMRSLFGRVFWGPWFIDVIMIQYLIFYIAKKASKDRENLMIAISFLLSSMVAVVFYIKGFNPRWYNGLLLFPTGMLIAYKEQELLALIRKKWVGYLVASSALFATWGGVFVYGKGSYSGIDICKIIAGIFLCLSICVIGMHIDLRSEPMQYIGKRSLFFYLIHINVMGICEGTEMNKITIFYVVILLTFILVEIFYRIYWLFRMRGKII